LPSGIVTIITEQPLQRRNRKLVLRNGLVEIAVFGICSCNVTMASRHVGLDDTVGTVFVCELYSLREGIAIFGHCPIEIPLVGEHLPDSVQGVRKVAPPDAIIGIFNEGFLNVQQSGVVLFKCSSPIFLRLIRVADLLLYIREIPMTGPSIGG